MLKSDFLKNERRLLSQPASYSGNQFYVSIRTVVGDSTTLKQNLKKTIDNILNGRYYIAIKLIAAIKMCKDAIIEQLKSHIQSHSHTCNIWFSGLRRICRIHPWDEQELSFPTHAWIDFEADSPVEANLAFEKLVETGLARRHPYDIPLNATHVFAYASKRN
jgi:hypothetical protein